MIEFFERLTKECLTRHLEFVIVGGYALIAWGVPRQTADIDLLIPEDERSAWKDLLADLGYGTPQEQGGFVQYPAPTVGAWPVDLVLVPNDTFDRVVAEAVPARFGQAVCPVAGVAHLLAMKFHALRYVSNRVGLKYLADVHALLRKTGLLVTNHEVRELCVRYGSKEIYDLLTGTSDPE